MAKIAQNYLFSWRELDSAGDLERLKLVLDAIPDEKLMQKLEARRGVGRDDYPVRPTWNSILALVVFQHCSIEGLRRELMRNAQLREACGFDPAKGAYAVPTSRAYSHFLNLLKKFNDELTVMFDYLVENLGKELPDMFEHLAVDSKAISSLGKPAKNGSSDGRRDVDADWGVKTRRSKNEDGVWEEKKTTWFGYKVHLMVDSRYELPAAYEVTPASANDSPLLSALMKKTKKRHKELLKRAKELSADRGYDSGKNCASLYDDYGINPVIAIKDCWQEDGEEEEGAPTRALNEDVADQIVYDFKGTVYCHCPDSGVRREMVYMGYEKDRRALKYRCPASAYGYECKGKLKCGSGKAGAFGRVIRIPIEKNRRIFTPLARSSYSWEKAYRRRTTVEHVNSRLDVSFGFERHYIRGMKKMKMRISVALIVMNAMALGRIKAKQKPAMRSLVLPAKAA